MSVDGSQLTGVKFISEAKRWNPSRRTKGGSAALNSETRSSAPLNGTALIKEPSDQGLSWTFYSLSDEAHWISECGVFIYMCIIREREPEMEKEREWEIYIYMDIQHGHICIAWALAQKKCTHT